MVRSRIEARTASSPYYAGLIAATAAAILLLFVTTPTTASAAVGGSTESLSEDDDTCLSCHDSEGMEKDLANGESLSLHIRGDAFANSIHGWVGCAGCHSDVDLGVHPEDEPIETLSAYSAEASRVCSQCHSRESLKDGPAHHARVSTAGGPACAECHDTHAATPISEWKAGIGETAYCLTCHGQSLGVRLASGDSFALSVDEAVLRDSVHLDHECADCHTGFSKESHETEAFANTREHAIALAQVCRKCHEGKFEQYEGSIHAALIKDGNLAAPVCTDCHGAHSVRSKAVYETVTGVSCKKCHANIFDAYVGSMHGQARSKLGHFEAPICADCHRAHDVGPAAAGNQLRDACLECHPGAMDAHQEWLPNTALHLEAVSCPACHAPMAQRRVELRLFDGKTQMPFSEPGDARQFENQIRSADVRGDGLDAFELWNLVRDINREGMAPEMTLQGRMGVRTGADAHRLSDKTGAIRDCGNCHQQGADAFQSVTVSIVGRDGRPVRYDADKDVLNSVMSVDSVSGFYAIGGTRIKLLDVLLVLAFLGGISVPVGHLTLKWLFNRYLKRTQEEGASQDS
jgi:hypothetical protein